jgi:hypothetical protein
LADNNVWQALECGTERVVLRFGNANVCERNLTPN